MKLRLLSAAVALALLAGCSGAAETSASSSAISAVTTSVVSSTASSTTKTSSSTSSTRTTPKPDPATIEAANKATCTALQDKLVKTNLGPLLDQFYADRVATGSTTLTPGQFYTAAGEFLFVSTDGTDGTIKSAVATLANAAKNYYMINLFDLEMSDLKQLSTIYESTIAQCEPYVVPSTVVINMMCSGASFATYQEAWAARSAMCEGQHVSGTEYTDQMRSAVTVAYGPAGDLDSVRTLYALCAAVGASFSLQIVSDSQAAEAAGQLIICPDHPDAAAIQANIDKITAAQQAKAAAAAADQSKAAAAAAGTFALGGSHLIGTDVQAGTWRSVGDKVEDCYWELSDAQGEIIDNNFISIAPQFELTIPSSASGFTNTGCEFERIGD